MTADDQQSVTMISEDTDSQDDTEPDHPYTQSPYQEAIMDIPYPDLYSDSDSDDNDSLFGTEYLDNLGATDHIVSNVQAMKVKLVDSLSNYLTQNLCQHYLTLEQHAHVYWPLFMTKYLRK